MVLRYLRYAYSILNDSLGINGLALFRKVVSPSSHSQSCVQAALESRARCRRNNNKIHLKIAKLLAVDLGRGLSYACAVWYVGGFRWVLFAFWSSSEVGMSAVTAQFSAFISVYNVVNGLYGYETPSLANTPRICSGDHWWSIIISHGYTVSSPFVCWMWCAFCVRKGFAA